MGTSTWPSLKTCCLPRGRLILNRHAAATASRGSREGGGFGGGGCRTAAEGHGLGSGSSLRASSGARSERIRGALEVLGESTTSSGSRVLVIY